jgi:hypothetical protein
MTMLVRTLPILDRSDRYEQDVKIGKGLQGGRVRSNEICSRETR